MVDAMPRKRSLGIAIALFAGVLFQEAYAVPSLTISSLRASMCCAGNCRNSRMLNDAARCCHVSQRLRIPRPFPRSRCQEWLSPPFVSV